MWLFGLTLIITDIYKIWTTCQCLLYLFICCLSFFLTIYILFYFWFFVFVNVVFGILMLVKQFTIILRKYWFFIDKNILFLMTNIGNQIAWSLGKIDILKYGYLCNNSPIYVWWSSPHSLATIFSSSPSKTLQKD